MRSQEDTPGKDHRGARWPLARLWVAGLLATLLLVALALVGVLAVGLGLRDGFRNPFATQTVDRSPPAVLQAVEDLSVYQAASGNYQVVLDIERDTPLVPPAISGERTLFVAVGTVDAEVDFSGLAEDAIQTSENRRAVTVTLPRPTLSPAQVDPEQSQVVSRERGLLDRLGGIFSGNPTSERKLYIAAERKIDEAAADSDLVSRAEANTRATLEGMLTSLGFTEVTVEFEEGPQRY